MTLGVVAKVFCFRSRLNSQSYNVRVNVYLCTGGNCFELLQQLSFDDHKYPIAIADKIANNINKMQSFAEYSAKVPPA